MKQVGKPKIGPQYVSLRLVVPASLHSLKYLAQLYRCSRAKPPRHTKIPSITCDKQGDPSPSQ